MGAPDPQRVPVFLCLRLANSLAAQPLYTTQRLLVKLRKKDWVLNDLFWELRDKGYQIKAKAKKSASEVK